MSTPATTKTKTTKPKTPKAPKEAPVSTDTTTEPAPTVDERTQSPALTRAVTLTQEINALEERRLALYAARRAEFVAAYEGGASDQAIGDACGLRRQNIHDQRNRAAQEQKDAAKG